jgi:predicted TIM-barrel fold metal-dependent hydrolase
MEKIDAFNHIWPRAFFERVQQLAPDAGGMARRVRKVPMITDLDERFRIMDLFEDYRQILSLASPPLDTLAGAEHAPELARVANDGMAELVDRHRDRFPGFIASVPMDDADAMLVEAQRAMQLPGAVGVQLFTNVFGRPIDGPDFRPLFHFMAGLDRPLWIHPARGQNFPDYLSEDRSRYEIWWAFGWPYETSAMMARLVFSKLFDELPDLKVITHHGGGMIPIVEGRLGPGYDQLGGRTTDEDYGKLLKELKRRPLDYFRLFYADTAMFGSRAATACALEFFGPERILFASDAPFDPEQGPMYIRETIRVIDSLDIGEDVRCRIYRDNVKELLQLD